MDEYQIKSSGSLERGQWLKEHTVLNNKFLNEAIEAGVKPLSIQFWVFINITLHF